MSEDKLRIGRCGELLVQLRLLKHDIDSAALSTDRGLDLVGFSDRKQDSFTIQVKAKWKPTPSGGKGRLALDWWIPHKCKADWCALVDLSRERIWLMSMKEIRKCDQQKRNPTRHHICMVTETDKKLKANAITRPENEFDDFLFENQVTKI